MWKVKSEATISNSVRRLLDFWTRLQFTMQGPTTQKAHVVRQRRSVRQCNFEIGLGRGSDRIRTRRGSPFHHDLFFSRGVAETWLD